MNAVWYITGFVCGVVAALLMGALSQPPGYGIH